MIWGGLGASPLISMSPLRGGTDIEGMRGSIEGGWLVQSVWKGKDNSDVPRRQKCSIAATKVETASTDDKTVTMDNKTVPTDDKTMTMFGSVSAVTATKRNLWDLCDILSFGKKEESVGSVRSV